jgi:asparagine synthase (glutamine-hydrolysing)
VRRYDARVCGIVGLFQPEQRFDPPDVERWLAAGIDALRHRGPDARGIAVLPEHGLGFGHVRLSILDLDARADQPLASPAGAVLTLLSLSWWYDRWIDG